jgi:hypothetical protein
MNVTSPTPDDARASLNEAESRAAAIRRADRKLRSLLLLVAGMYLASAALLSVNPRQGNLWISYALLVILVGGLAAALYLNWRIRVWSRLGAVWLLASVAVFLLWEGAVIWVSIATGWWGPHQPGIHFGGSVVMAVIPLLVAAWLIGRR